MSGFVVFTLGWLRRSWSSHDVIAILLDDPDVLLYVLSNMVARPSSFKSPGISCKPSIYF